MSWAETWWIWIVAGVVLGILEVLVPSYLFLGFAIGAVMTGILVGLGILGASWQITFLVFALASLGGWIATRRLQGKHTGQVKIWDRDINDD